jgi:hypothetical protein
LQGVSLDNITHCEDSTQCVEFPIPVSISVDTTYTLELPAGSSFHPYGGQTASSLSFKLSGLFSFVVPFMSNLNHVANNRFGLWMRHGLQDIATALQGNYANWH